MEHLEAIVKALSVLLATLVPLIKPLFGRKSARARHLDERYRRVKAFFDDGGTARHPMLVEASFAAATGQAALNAREIELLLRQRCPTEFMAVYMRCRAYIRPDEAGDGFVLRGLAAHAGLRRTLVALGKLVYALSAGPAFWTMVYVVLPSADRQGWLATGIAVALCVMAASLGFLALIGSSRLHHAAELFQKQVLPMSAREAEPNPAAAGEAVLPLTMSDNPPAPALEFPIGATAA